MPETLANIVSDEEKVARVIFSPSYIYNGRVAPTAFRWEILPSGDAEDYISVLRYHSGYSIDEQTKHFRARTEGDSRYGYAVLETKDIRNIENNLVLENRIDVDVLPFPSKRLPNHAGIVVDVNNNRVTANTPVTPELMFIQKMLASICSDIVKF